MQWQLISSLLFYFQLHVVILATIAVAIAYIKQTQFHTSGYSLPDVIFSRLSVPRITQFKINLSWHMQQKDEGR